MNTPNTAHTPGPWKVWRRKPTSVLIEISTAQVPTPSLGQIPITTIDRRLNASALANASLIACAPELLAMLRKLLATGRNTEAYDTACDEACRLIYKAEGRSHE